jgi:hypothetical protein
VDAIFVGSILGRWLTFYSGEMVDTFSGVNGLGPGSTRLAMELADLPGHPARKAARRHKMAVEESYAELLKRAGVPQSGERAKEIAILAEGATALILIHGSTTYADIAAGMARQLLGSAGPRAKDE